MKTPFTYLFLALYMSLALNAQDSHKIDSLQNLLRTGKLADEKRTKVLYSIAFNYLTTNDSLTFIYADSAMTLAKKTGDKKILGDAYSLQGVVYKNQGKFQKAIEKHLLGLKIKESIADTLGVAICYNDIGVLYKVTKNYIKANEYYRLAHEFFRQANKKKGMSYTYNNIGTIFKELGNSDSSIIYYKKALAIAEEIKYKPAISTVCSNIGEYYGIAGNDELALVYFKKSLAIDLETGDVYGIIISNINIGEANTKMKKYGDALKNYHTAEQLCIENGEKPMLKDLYKSIARCYSFDNDKGKAYDYLLKYTALNDSLQTDEISKSILDVETKYQTEKKDLEIAKNKVEIENKEKQVYIKNIIIAAVILVAFLLVLMGVQISRKKQVEQKAEMDAEVARQKNLRSKFVIEAEEKERIRIAIDLHDGVGQLLSAAKLNLSSLENKIRIETPEQEMAFKNALSLVDDSVKEVRAVSHNMMPNTLLKLGLASAVKEFITKIQGIPNLKVNLEIVGLNERLEQEKETVLYRVIQEVVANIIKHSKASELTLQMIRHEKEISILVEDNGVGFDTSKMNDFEGIGLKNIISRIEFINGTVHFDSAINRGTTVVIDVATG